MVENASLCPRRSDLQDFFFKFLNYEARFEDVSFPTNCDEEERKDFAGIQFIVNVPQKRAESNYNDSTNKYFCVLACFCGFSLGTSLFFSKSWLMICFHPPGSFINLGFQHSQFIFYYIKSLPQKKIFFSSLARKIASIRS